MLAKMKPSSAIAVTGDDTPCGIVLSDWSVAEMVNEPAASNATRRVLSPLTKAIDPGSVAVSLVEVSATTLVMLLTVFQLSSQARTTTSNAIPTVCAVGVPNRPVTVPGAADSPGRSTCTRLYDCAETVGAIAINNATVVYVMSLNRVAKRTSRSPVVKLFVPAEP